MEEEWRNDGIGEEENEIRYGRRCREREERGEERVGEMRRKRKGRER